MSNWSGGNVNKCDRSKSDGQPILDRPLGRRAHGDRFQAVLDGHRGAPTRLDHREKALVLKKGGPVVLADLEQAGIHGHGFAGEWQSGPHAAHGRALADNQHR